MSEIPERIVLQYPGGREEVEYVPGDLVETLEWQLVAAYRRIRELRAALKAAEEAIAATLDGDTPKRPRSERYAELSRKLEEWANDPTDFDERVAPLIEQALREASPRHFQEGDD